MKNLEQEIAEEILKDAVDLGSDILHSGAKLTMTIGGSERMTLMAKDAIDYALDRDWLCRELEGVGDGTRLYRVTKAGREFQKPLWEKTLNWLLKKIWWVIGAIVVVAAASFSWDLKDLKGILEMFQK